MQHLIDWTFEVFDSLDPDKEYQLAFSCGKDSHALAAVYVAWTRSRCRKLKATLVFSDTYLESPKIYGLLEKIKPVCDREDIPLVTVHPEVEKNFWVLLFGRGYPVPNYQNRWCTKELKRMPMSTIPGVVIAGSHLGESSNRDQRLKGCGSTECGIDTIADKIEPLAVWRNCSVWDFLLLFGDEMLYPGVAEGLMGVYDLQDPKDQSLRFGCFMCTAVPYANIAKQANDGIIPLFSTDVRSLLEELRHAPRIRSERLDNSGAIHVDARIEVWQKMQPYIPSLKEYGWMSAVVQARIEELLSIRAYPETYRQEWIDQQEPLAKPWIENELYTFDRPELAESTDWLHDRRFDQMPAIKTTQTKNAMPQTSSLTSMMTYNLPVIKGRQGQHEYFVANIPYAVLLNITVFDETAVSFDNQAQRPLEKSRVQGIQSYMLGNPGDYVFNSLVVAVGTDVEFEPQSEDNPLGVLKLPIDSVCRIVDGQHRWHGIKEAVKENPDLRSDTVSVVFFLGDINRVRQIFTDLNLYAKKPNKSISIAYDSRDDRSIIVNAIHHEIPFFRKFVDANANTVPPKSAKLFSLQHLYQATQIHLEMYKKFDVRVRKERALDFWNRVYEVMLDWQAADRREIPPIELKRDYVCTQGVSLLAIAMLGSETEDLSILSKIDWLKTNKFWSGLLIDESGKMLPGKQNARRAVTAILRIKAETALCK